MKKLISILSLSTILLIGCSDNNDVEGTEQAEQNHEIDESDITVEEDPIEDDVQIEMTSDSLVVESNHIIRIHYHLGMVTNNEDVYNEIQTPDELNENVDMINTVAEELLANISNHLNDEPYQTNNDKSINELTKANAHHVDMLSLNNKTEHTGIFIINKNIDKFVEQNASELNGLPVLTTLQEYTDNTETAESISELNKTIFENDTYIVKVRPSSTVLGYNTDNLDQVIQSLNDYAEYFTTNDVQAIFEAHLSE